MGGNILDNLNQLVEAALLARVVEGAANSNLDLGADELVILDDIGVNLEFAVAAAAVGEAVVLDLVESVPGGSASVVDLVVSQVCLGVAAVGVAPGAGPAVVPGGCGGGGGGEGKSCNLESDEVLHVDQVLCMERCVWRCLCWLLV